VSRALLFDNFQKEDRSPLEVLEGERNYFSARV